MSTEELKERMGEHKRDPEFERELERIRSGEKVGREEGWKPGFLQHGGRLTASGIKQRVVTYLQQRSEARNAYRINYQEAKREAQVEQARRQARYDVRHGRRGGFIGTVGRAVTSPYAGNVAANANDYLLGITRPPPRPRPQRSKVQYVVVGSPQRQAPKKRARRRASSGYNPMFY